jgi:hypothetical protein
VGDRGEIVNIRIEATAGCKVPLEYVTLALEKALSRIAMETTTARASFTDVNGPKKGVDIACTLVIALPGRPALPITRRATTARLAFDACYDIAVRRLEDERERRARARRRPRKYYAAKRLLA